MALTWNSGSVNVQASAKAKLYGACDATVSLGTLPLLPLLLLVLVLGLVLVLVLLLLLVLLRERLTLLRLGSSTRVYQNVYVLQQG